MAIYHLHVDVVSRSTGRSAVAAAAYRAGEKLKNERDGVTHDYSPRSSMSAAAYQSGEHLGEADFTHKRGVIYTEIILPNNAPKEYADRSTLWNAVETVEKRRDAQTAREIDVALPIELNRPEQIKLLQDYISENFTKHGMIADFAIHDKNDGNPHAHILLTTREVSEAGFGKKNREWNKPEYLLKWRENWAKTCNREFERLGLDERIDHRTLEAQGVDREPTIHVGVEGYALEKKGIVTERMRRNRAIIERNRAKSHEATAEYMHELKQGFFILNKQIAALQHETAEVEREIRALKHRAEKIDEHAPQVRDKHGRAHFKRIYGVELEQADAEIKRLESRARSLGHLREKLREKSAAFVEERNGFEAEYQRQNSLMEISAYKQQIHDRLAQFSNESRPQSPKDRLAYIQNERIFAEKIEELTRPPKDDKTRRRVYERGR